MPALCLMTIRMIKTIFCGSLCAVLLYGHAFGEGLLQLPILPAPENYGDILISRPPQGSKVAPVIFSHWVHRVKYTCRVCHYELEFSMKSNDSPITCNKGQINGKYCVACHDGKIAFGPRDEDGENCDRCHTSFNSAWRRFQELRDKLPPAKFGNEIDWSAALAKDFIKPRQSLSGGTREIANIDKTLTLNAEMSGISPAVFPHKTHEQWLDCSNCHPELFNMKKKSTENLRMVNMLKGESCGICHLFVALPLNDCRKCHPKMNVR